MLFPQEKVDGEIIQTNYTTDTINHASTDYIKLYQDFVWPSRETASCAIPSAFKAGMLPSGGMR